MFTGSKTVFSLISLCALVACDPKAAPKKDQTPTKLADEVQLPEPLQPLLRDKVAREVAVAPGALSYAIPEGCMLEYEVRAGFEMIPVDRPNPAMRAGGMTLRQSFEMSRGGPADFEITWGATELRHKRDGVERPGSKGEPGSMAKTWLKVENDRLVEVKGPTAAWSAYGTFPGPVVFFPALPKAPVKWAPTVHEQGSGIAVEVERGTVKLSEGQVPPAPRAVDNDGEVKLVRWVDIEGKPVALIEATWSSSGTGVSQTPGGKLTQKATSAQIGRYLVSADGQLLGGQYESDVDLEMGSPQQTMKVKTKASAVIRLVRGCTENALTFPPSPEDISPEERALNLLARHRNHLAKGDWDAAAKDFAPEIHKAHTGSIAELLELHYTRYGVGSFGTPEIAVSTKIRKDRAVVHMVGRAENYEREGDNMSINTFAYVHVGEGEAALLGVGSDTVKKDFQWGLLEVSEDRFHSRLRVFREGGQTELEAAQAFCDAPKHCKIERGDVQAAMGCVNNRVKVRTVREVIDAMPKASRANLYPMLHTAVGYFGFEGECELAAVLGDKISFEDAFVQMCGFAHKCPQDAAGFAKCLEKRIPDNLEIREMFATDDVMQKWEQVRRTERSFKLLNKPFPECAVAERWEKEAAKVERTTEPTPSPESMPTPPPKDDNVVREVQF